MIEQHIINFRSFSDESEHVLADLQTKVFEYEKILHYKKINYNKMFFLKKIFEKKETNEINELIEIIQEITFNMKEKQSQYDNKKKEFFELYKSYVLDEHIEFSHQYKNTKSAFKNIEKVRDIMDESLKIGKSSIDWFENSIKNFNDLNKIRHSININPKLYNALLSEFLEVFGKSITFVSRFKKNIIHGKEQISNISADIRLDGWDNLILIIQEDKSENIVLSKSFHRMSISHNINEINNTLAILHTAYKVIKNEIDKLSDDYNDAKQRYERLDIELNMLMNAGLKNVNTIFKS